MKDIIDIDAVNAQIDLIENAEYNLIQKLADYDSKIRVLDEKKSKLSKKRQDLLLEQEAIEKVKHDLYNLRDVYKNIKIKRNKKKN